VALQTLLKTLDNTIIYEQSYHTQITKTPGDIDKSYEILVSCRKFDDSDKPCKTLLKTVKNLIKAFKQCDELIKTGDYKPVLEMVKEIKVPTSLNPKVFKYQCLVYHKLKKYKLQVEYCEKYIETGDLDVDVLVWKGEGLIGLEKVWGCSNFR
jgi:hypothetical protein